MSTPQDPNATQTDTAPASVPRRIPGSVIALGLVSLFADIASEMVYPLMPFFLIALGATAVDIGLIEGVAESTASSVNLFSGWLSDKIGKRKALAIFGYALAAIMYPVMGLAHVWGQVFAARFVNRIGKGIRTSPRDALVAASAPPELRGRAFGLQRSLDHTGAVIGPLLAALLLWLMGTSLSHVLPKEIPIHNYQIIFYLSLIPGLLAVLILWLGVREKKTEGGSGKPLPSLNLKSLRGPFGAYCLVATLFAVGNSSNTFLLLRANELGLALSLTPIAYVLMNVTAAIFSTPAGMLSDRLGRRGMLIAGFLVSSLVYVGFAATHHPGAAWALFAIYGVYVALTDGMQRAYAADLAPKDMLGTAMGTFNTFIGVALLPASIIAGWLWNHVSPAAPFWFGGVTSLLAAVLLWVMLPGKHSSEAKSA
jgi:MFS family permease